MHGVTKINSGTEENFDKKVSFQNASYNIQSFSDSQAKK